MQTNCRRLSAARAGLLVVDMQERLLPAMAGHEDLLQNTLALVHGASCLGLKMFVSEQYPKGLGRTVPQIVSAVPGFAPFEKVHFSACGAPGLADSLNRANVSDVILCGIEAHVCVTQTCLDLLDSALGVFVVADATSSRTSDNHRYALDRMRDAGAAIVCTEMVLFELLQKAGTEEFKKVLSLIK